MGYTGDDVRATGIASVISSPFRDLLKRTGSNWNAHLGALAIQVLAFQLETYNAHKAKATAPYQQPETLFDTTAVKIAESLGNDAEEDLKALVGTSSAVVRRAMVRLNKLTYPGFCVLNRLELGSAPDAEASFPWVGTDEWCVTSPNFIDNEY